MRIVRTAAAAFIRLISVRAGVVVPVCGCRQRGFRLAHARLHIPDSGHRRTTGEDER